MRKTEGGCGVRERARRSFRDLAKQGVRITAQGLEERLDPGIYTQDSQLYVDCAKAKILEELVRT